MRRRSGCLGARALALPGARLRVGLWRGHDRVHLHLHLHVQLLRCGGALAALGPHQLRALATAPATGRPLLIRLLVVVALILIRVLPSLLRLHSPALGTVLPPLQADFFGELGRRVVGVLQLEFFGPVLSQHGVVDACHQVGRAHPAQALGLGLLEEEHQQLRLLLHVAQRVARLVRGQSPHARPPVAAAVAAQQHVGLRQLLHVRVARVQARRHQVVVGVAGRSAQPFAPQCGRAAILHTQQRCRHGLDGARAKRLKGLEPQRAAARGAVTLPAAPVALPVHRLDHVVEALVVAVVHAERAVARGAHEAAHARHVELLGSRGLALMAHGPAVAQVVAKQESTDGGVGAQRLQRQQHVGLDGDAAREALGLGLAQRAVGGGVGLLQLRQRLQLGQLHGVRGAAPQPGHAAHTEVAVAGTRGARDEAAEKVGAANVAAEAVIAVVRCQVHALIGQRRCAANEVDALLTCRLHLHLPATQQVHVRRVTLGVRRLEAGVIRVDLLLAHKVCHHSHQRVHLLGLVCDAHLQLPHVLRISQRQQRPPPPNAAYVVKRYARGGGSSGLCVAQLLQQLQQGRCPLAQRVIRQPHDAVHLAPRHLPVARQHLKVGLLQARGRQTIP